MLPTWGQAQLQPMPAWHSTSRRVLGLAVAASLLAHSIVYFAMLSHVNEFSPIKTLRYDASLVQLESQPEAKPTRAPTPTPTLGSNAKPKPVAAPQIQSVNTTAAKQDDFQEAPQKFSAETASEEVATAAGSLATQPSLNVNADSLSQLPAASSTPPSILEPDKPQAVSTGQPEAKPEAQVETKRTMPAFAERISIEYKLTSAVTDGVANFKWMRKGSTYEIESSTEATGFLVSAFAGAIYQQSRGEITEDGLRPTWFSIRRGEGVTDTAEFQRSTNSLSLKGARAARILPLNAQLQDMQSFLFQLSVEAPRLVTDSDRLEVLVTNARKVYRYQFRRVGPETLHTRIGKIETIRLISDAVNPEDVYEVWLAPQYFYLPVKIKLYIGRFPVEQLATRIGISDQ